MKAIQIARLKDALSATLRRVERGESIVVTDRDRPIARLVPIEDDEGGVTLLPPSGSFTTVRRKRFPPTRRRSSSLAALLAERGER